MGHSLLCYTQLLGQEKAKKMVSRSLVGDRIPHAYIFRGPNGVGRKLFARGLAAAMNCRKGESSAACGECASCRKYLSANHPDFLVVSPEKNGISIGRVRELSRELTYPPYEAAKRVVVLEDVHLMRREAANSLLKTLEEPPENNLVILTAESSREILPTLVSRCQVVPFFGLSESETLFILEQYGIESDDGRLYARFAEGSPGKALMLKQTELIELWREVIALLLNQSAETGMDLDLTLELAEKMAALKDDLGELLIFLKMWLRDMLVCRKNTGLTGKGLGELTGEGEKVPKSWSSRLVFAKLQTIGMAEKALARNCNRLLVCEIMLFRLLESGKPAWLDRQAQPFCGNRTFRGE